MSYNLHYLKVILYTRNTSSLVMVMPSYRRIACSICVSVDDVMMWAWRGCGPGSHGKPWGFSNENHGGYRLPVPYFFPKKNKKTSIETYWSDRLFQYETLHLGLIPLTNIQSSRILNFRKGWKRSKQGGAPPVMFVGIPIIVTIDISTIIDTLFIVKLEWVWYQIFQSTITPSESEVMAHLEPFQRPIFIQSTPLPQAFSISNSAPVGGLGTDEGHDIWT